MMKTRFLLQILLISVFLVPLRAQTDLKYQTPPRELVAVVDALRNPSVQFDPDGRYMLLMRRPGYPGIKDLAAEMLRLGGIRIDPATNGRSRPHYYITLEFRDLDTNISRSITGLPDPFRFTSVSWSPDGKGFALTELKQDGLYLWYVDVTELKARQLLTQPLNELLGSSVVWLPDGSGMMVKLIPLKRGARPELPKVPVGPVIQENTGSEAAVRTYQDLLKNPFDVALFDYFVQSELYLVKPDGSATLLGPKAAYMGIDPSPDGNYLLMNRMTKPYSYLVPYYYFPHTTEIWDTNGNRITTLFRQPLMENIPTGYDATIPGPRSVQWRNDMPATLVWVQALDGGNGKKQVPFRDQIYTLKAPFSGSPVTWFKTRLRYSGITWGRQDFALVTEQSSKTRQQITRIFDPSKETPVPEVLWDLSSEDRYHNPGRFVTQTNEQGRQVLLFDKRGRNLFLVGQGASPQGNQPFLDKFNVKTHATTRLWQSGAPYYESVIKILDTRKIVLITRRESVTEPVNYYIRVPDAGTLTPLTHFANPYPFMAGVTRQIIKYDRDDGVHLSATLYLPAGWKPSDGPLPTLLWAYPREYKSKSAAGQISGSPYSFSRVSPTSAIPFVTQGYAIIDGAAFPIIGEGDEEPNDHFVEQLVANAKAAIDKAVAMGVTDPKRVAVGGHSYGAFMTANLLIHSDLFAAGIARSGAYNRTLTPFGFQSERRTYWEAPDLYYDMSPFMHADQMKHPLLMIHGIADNNSGTFPIQSERFYAALKGHGATVRLVMLPLESHGYMARESLLHMLWEMNRWMEQYLKY